MVGMSGMAASRPAVVTPSSATAQAEDEESDEDNAAGDDTDDALASVGAGANGAKPGAARMTTEQTGAEE